MEAGGGGGGGGGESSLALGARARLPQGDGGVGEGGSPNTNRKAMKLEHIRAALADWNHNEEEASKCYAAAAREYREAAALYHEAVMAVASLEEALALEMNRVAASAPGEAGALPNPT